jgi:alkylation response protein AidB-like acyl-CoA dehydrogenase
VRRDLFLDQHEALRSSVRSWIADRVVPKLTEWDQAGVVPRELFADAGDHGFIGFDIPEEYGGGGVFDFRLNAVVNEEFQRVGASAVGLGLTLHNDICLPYFVRYSTPEQCSRWLPGIASGALITAVAMTEPTMGSDLASMTTTARRDGDVYIVNGSKTFITNGINADLVICAVKTDLSQRHEGISLLVVERGMKGFSRGRNLDKIGNHAQDTAELFFDDVAVPCNNLLGIEGGGFAQLTSNLPQERLSIAIAGVAAARASLTLAREYASSRRAFGQPIGSFQNTRFVLAETATEIEVSQSFVDRCILALNADELTPVDAAMAKWWCTEVQKRAADRCLQLFGGYGYMNEYPIAKAYLDARVTTIYGGTTEIMKEIIGRSLISRMGS